MKNLSACIKELHMTADTLHSIADTLAQLPVDDTGSASSPAPAAEPVTLEEVRAVLADKSVQGHTAAVQALIHKRGVEKLSQVDPAHYASLLAEAEAL